MMERIETEEWGKDPAHKHDHYPATGVVWDCIEQCDLNFNLGNVVKYVCRAGKKGDRKNDLQKAMDYLQREVDRP